MSQPVGELFQCIAAELEAGTETTVSLWEDCPILVQRDFDNQINVLPLSDRAKSLLLNTFTQEGWEWQ